MVLTIAVAWLLPVWFGYRLKEYVSVAQGSVLFLGAALALQTSLGAFNGVLTGCHRWELQSLRLSGWYFVTVTAMLIALWQGAGLVTLAAITFVGQAMGQLTMVTLAYRVCDGLKLSRDFVHWKTIKELYIFGGKTLTPIISTMLLNQTASLLIVAALGPAALAVFSRPRSLLTQLDSLERKMSMILTPTTSSLEHVGDVDEIKNLLTKGVRYSLYLILPAVLVMVVFGGAVLHIWMGSRYANGIIPAILAIGFLGSSVHTPILSMLEGMNMHGKAGVAQLIASIISVGLIVLGLQVYHAGLVGVAFAVTLPLLIVNLIYLPRLICRHLGLSLTSLFRAAIIAPLIHILPFAACLVVVRMLYQSHPIPALLLLSGSAIALAVSYWRLVLPPRLKQSVYDCLNRTLTFVAAACGKKRYV
jgi:O-antigen/teichoic acid export membrane protein